MNSTPGGHMYHSSEDLLPYRCPSCGSGKRFRSLVALRMHMSIIHDMPDTSNTGNDSTCMLEKSEMEKPERMKSENLDESVSQREVDAIFNKYSGRMDNMLTKYDSQSKELADRIKMAKQLEQIKNQKKDLNLIKTSWETVHGLSQLVEDTDRFIRSRPEDTAPIPSTQTTATSSSQLHVESPASPRRSENDELLHQRVDASVMLAAKYKTLAIEAEHKLQEKMEEEKHTRKFIEAVAEKERAAKKKLSDFLEEILQRAENAEHELQMYKSQSSPRHQPHINRRSSLPVGSSSYSPNSSNKKKRHRTKTATMHSNTPLSRSRDSGISSPTHHTPQPSKFDSSPVDPFILSVLEPPSSQELRRKWPPRGGDKEQLYGVDTHHLVDGMSLLPFSNMITINTKATSANFASDRRVVLFCIFSRMRSVDLLSAATVCREWRDVSRHPQLWSRIRFDNLRIDGKLLKHISRWSSDTCYLHLHNISLLPSNQESMDTETGCLEDGLEMILRSCGDNLLVIAIERCDPVITSRSMWLVSCYNRRIRHIIYRSSLDPISHQVAWSLGSACREITSLEVAPVQPCYVPGLFDNNVTRLLSWCWPQLQALSFGGRDIDGSALISVALNCPHIKVVELDHAKGISQESAMTACKHGLKDLHTLILTHTPIRSSTLLLLLSSSSHLQYLHMVVAQSDYYPSSSKLSKVHREYMRITKDLKSLQEDPSYSHVVHIECQ